MNQQIIESKSNELATTHDGVDAFEIISSRNSLFEKILEVAIRSTNAGDWIDQNGSPYLQASGAEKIARRFGVKISNINSVREDIEDASGKYHMYTVTGVASLGDRDQVEAMGVCSTRDKFFGIKNGEFKQLQDVDLPSIKRKAYTNFLGNAIKRLLGLRGLSWDDLSRFNISKNGKKTVQYKNQNVQQPEPKKTQDAHPQTEGAQKSFWEYEADGKKYICARAGGDFSPNLLGKIGMQKSQKSEGVFYAEYSDEVINMLKELGGAK